MREIFLHGNFENFKREFDIIFGNMNPNELIKEMQEASCDMEFLENLEESSDENA
jgi:hypothetical protein